MEGKEEDNGRERWVVRIKGQKERVRKRRMRGKWRKLMRSEGLGGK